MLTNFMYIFLTVVAVAAATDAVIFVEPTVCMMHFPTFIDTDK